MNSSLDDLSDARPAPYTVRNVECYERSQDIRQRIRSLLVQHPPLSPPLTAKDVLTKLPDIPLSIRAVQWHMQAIRSESTLIVPAR